jgi:hypothetical protein
LTPRRLIAIAAVAAIVGVVVVLLTRRSEPASVPPVPHATTAAQEARNLEAWLRSYSRRGGR